MEANVDTITNLLKVITVFDKGGRERNSSRHLPEIPWIRPS